MLGITVRPLSIPRISLGAASVIMTPESIVQRIGFTYTGSKTVEAFSSNENTGVKIEGSDIVLTAQKSGTSQVTLRAGSVSKTLNVSLTDIPSATLANNTPEIIQRTVRAGYAKRFWTPGDKMPRKLSGTVGVTNVAGDYYDVLLDIDHNPQYEGEHNAQFGLAWYGIDGQTPIAFVDDKYNTSYTDARQDFRMNPTYQNLTTGYSGMQLRSVLQKFYDAITDSKLKSVITAGPKYTDDGIFTAQGESKSSDVKILRDKIWIPRHFEMFAPGDSSWGPASEQPFSERFPAYLTAAARIAYSFKDTTKAVWYWLASRSTGTAGHFRTVSSSGGPNYIYASASGGVRPCYTIS